MNKFIINCTPHDINVLNELGNRIVLIPKLPADSIARVATSSIKSCDLDIAGAKVPVSRTELLQVTNLPAERPGVALIVSALVRLALPLRKDLFSPGELVRNDAGQPIGCRGLEGNL